ncbi:flagellar hook-associated protein FlgK [Phaeovulum sp.]|uniref:flagellar hook-associated protein FlgK n=1 Tax=Phaeovulum sp. TaxID=2934796 RepID=UPI0039E5BCD8
MSISSSLSNALSGLSAASRAAEVVSANTANALTAGYARRELSLSSLSLGGDGAGVRINGVNRVVDQAVLSDRRLAMSETENSSVKTDFYTKFEASLGAPGADGSLSSRIVKLESSMIEAASRPDSEARLAAVLNAAKGVTGQLNTLSKDLGQTRMQADNGIADTVTSLNDALSRIDQLNSDILAQRASGRDATSLMDQRQEQVDKVALIVPIREVARDHDQISLFTTGGAILLEGNAVTIGFSPVGVITPDMTLASGALSGLTINDIPVSASDHGVLGGGRLGALFAIRDELAPKMQTQLDAFARDLISRFQDSDVDPTLSGTALGLFTDAGAAFDPMIETGLAERISINSDADPEKDGALRRLRDGLGPGPAGSVGDASLLTAMAEALTAPHPPASGSFLGAARSSSGLAGDLLSQASGARLSAEERQSYATARFEALTELQLADGVDIDHEMQVLLQVEQAYAANARVIKTVDELIQQILAL